MTPLAQTAEGLQSPAGGVGRDVALGCGTAATAGYLEQERTQMISIRTADKNDVGSTTSKREQVAVRAAYITYHFFSGTQEHKW